MDASLVTQGTTLDPSLVTKGNDADVEKILADSDDSNTVDIKRSYDSDTTSKNNSDIIFDIPNMDPNRDKEEHDYVGNEKQRVLSASSVNHEPQKVNAFLTKVIERYKENHFAKDKIN
ncbi:hypothetical protein Tco_1575541 [Tanacetum coccineum]